MVWFLVSGFQVLVKVLNSTGIDRSVKTLRHPKAKSRGLCRSVLPWSV